VAATACGGSPGPFDIPVPHVGTDFVIYASVPQGQTARPETVHIARTAELPATVRLEVTGDTLGDMFFAGLKNEDLPSVLSADPRAMKHLVVLSHNDEHARALPPLYLPFVLSKLARADVPNRFIATITDPDAALRFMNMITNLAVEDPCVDPVEPLHVVAPMIPADEINVLKTLSSGDTFLGVSATSTAVLVRLAPGSEDPQVIGVSTGTMAVRAGDVVRVPDLGDTEAMDPAGRPIPGTIPLDFLGPFGEGLGQLESYSSMRGLYVMDTPVIVGGTTQASAPGLFGGSRHLTIDGKPSLCTYGTAQGPNDVAAIWCRDAMSSKWRITGEWRSAFDIIGILQNAQTSYAIDFAGTIYGLSSGMWTPLVAFDANRGCNPPCEGISIVQSAPAGSGMLGVIAGAKAQVIAIQDGAGTPQYVPLSNVANALFADERQDSDTALLFQSLKFGPDGTLWIASPASIVLHASADMQSFDRVCMPREAKGASVKTIEPHPDGRLIVAFNPSLLGFGRWK
jgi:hypothetical protein